MFAESDNVIIRFVMALQQITVTEAARNFSDLINRIHYRGESAMLIKGTRPMVRMLPARQPKTGAELAAIWPTLPHLTPSEAAHMEADILAAQRNLRPLEAKWE